MIELIFYLLCGHALADFALQSDVMAKGKNRHNIPIIPKGQKLVPCWFYWLIAHSLIHGLCVVWLTSPYTLGFMYGVFATVAHFVIDFAKCENWTNPHTDQILHMLTLIGMVIHFYY